LIDQTVAAFEVEGLRCPGVMQGIRERADCNQPVQICSVHTIARLNRPDPEFVIVDEAHPSMRAKAKVEAVAGELVELGSHHSGVKAPDVAEKAAFLGNLKGHAAMRRYADGRTLHKYRERFGVCPNDPRIRCARAAPLTLKTTNGLISRQIAFAKATERVAHG
jgi:hypothetical protein